ncbi:MAG: hypothetical protein EB078_08310, partial [Proteobacteria bacterium]|nr:hypothetical protein [Pseudomonadota bacterium]
MNYAQKLSVCLLSIILSLVSVLAFAESYSTTDNRTIIRSGFQVQRFKGGNTDSGTQGLMVGYRSSRYLYKGFSLGIEAVAGAPQDGSIVDNNVFYTGLTLGWDQSFLKILTYEFDVLVGYGYGKSDNLGVSGDGFTIQPQVG